MDPDLLLDLRHLDDPEPPRFGALRADEAARLAGRHQARRARLLAGAVLAVLLVAGVAAVGLGQDGSTAVHTAQAPPETVPVDPVPVPDPVAPTETPSTSAVPSVEPTTTLTAPPTTAGPSAQPGSAGPGPTARPSLPSGSPTPTTRPPAGAISGRSPEGTVAALSGLRFTLTLDASQVAAGGTVRGVVRFENNRSTTVTVGGGGCTAEAIWRPDLYQAGRPMPSEPVCLMAIGMTVRPGTAQQTEVQLKASPDLAAGRYDAFAVIRVEEDQQKVHTELVEITVVRP